MRFEKMCRPAGSRDEALTDFKSRQLSREASEYYFHYKELERHYESNVTSFIPATQPQVTH